MSRFEIKRALVSVFDKNKLDHLIPKLQSHGFGIISTGKTAKKINELGYQTTAINEVTGVTEYPSGLVKTLHPRIHFALLADRNNPDHLERLKKDNILPIDLVVCNLYAFDKVADKKTASDQDIQEMIDIGGPAMIRAAAKNWPWVTVLVSPDDYQGYTDMLDEFSSDIFLDYRKKMASKAFEHTANYDLLIHKTLSKRFNQEVVHSIRLSKGRELRYGENPHQKAIVYKKVGYSGPSIVNTKQLSGKELSFNNYLDADSALEAVLHFKKPAVCIIKHTNPCGLATGQDIALALKRAWQGDPISAFGSVICSNREVNRDFIEFLEDKFIEVIVAPSFSKEATEILKKYKKKNLRLLVLQNWKIAKKRELYKFIHGGFLVQDEDDLIYQKWDSPTKKKYPSQYDSLGKFAMQAVKNIRSNEIVIAREYEKGYFQILGIGAGQPNRIDAIKKLAIPKANQNLFQEAENEQIKNAHKYVQNQLQQSVLASGAFFPFADSIEEIAKSGIKYIIQPGGSRRDKEVIAACDKYNLSMIFTGIRHFRH